MTGPEPIEFSVGVEGMSCASCSNRIERFLHDADGITAASVNLATERATVAIDPAVAFNSVSVVLSSLRLRNVRMLPGRADP